MEYVYVNFHWFILLIGALVFFHELGHFVAAKIFDVKVLRFSLGFGPRLFGFVRGETEYWISALPLGGYVRMLGEIPGVEIPAEDLPRAFSSKKVWQRSVIAAAGPAFNFLLALVVCTGLFVGTHTFGQTRLGLVRHGGPAWNAGLRPGDRITSIAGEPVTQWDQLVRAISSRPGESVSLSFEREGVEHTVTLNPRAHTQENLFRELEQKGRIGVSLQYVKPFVAVVDPDSPAAAAGIKTGDRILEVGGEKVMAWHEVTDRLAKLPPGESVELQVSTDGEPRTVTFSPGSRPAALEDFPRWSAADTAEGYTGIVSQDSVVHAVEPGTPAESIGLQPGDRLLALTMTNPEGQSLTSRIDSWDIDLVAFSGVRARNEFTLAFQRGVDVKTGTFKLAAKNVKDEFKNEYIEYEFGASRSDSVVGSYLFDREVGFFEALVRAASQVGHDATLIGKGLGLLARGRLPLDTMGGPIMLFVIAEKSAKQGWDYFLRMMAMISVNLGLLNLLPVPMLDGGHLLFFGIEAVRRRPPSMRTREIAHAVGLALLIALMLLVFKNDFLRYVLG